MSIVFWGLCPHPPLLIPGIADSAKEKAATTIASFKQWALQLKEQKPDRLIIMSPHAPAASAAVPIFSVASLSGSMQRFGCPEVSLNVDCDTDFIEHLSSLCREEDFPLLTVNDDLIKQHRLEINLDHGTLIPLYFLQEAGLDVPIVLLGYGPSYTELYIQLGKIVKKVAEEETDKKTAIIASGDLSHRLSESGPYGFSPYGFKFDESINKVLDSAEVESLLNFSNEEVNEAAQCGLYAIAMLLGSLEKDEICGKRFSYEAPYGVGYSVVGYLPKNVAFVDNKGLSDSTSNSTKEVGSEDKTTTEKDVASVKITSPLNFMGRKQAGAAKVEFSDSTSGKGAKTVLDPRLELARRSVESYVLNGERLSLKEGEYPNLQDPAAVFVTLKEHGQLRGCIGSLMPIETSQAGEIVRNAILACSQDPRFPAVSAEELPQLQYQVYVLGEPVKIRGPQELDPKRYGVIVRKDGRSGVLLPNLEGIDSIDMQLRIACQKGGILPEEKPELYRFTATTYSE